MGLFTLYVRILGKCVYFAESQILNECRGRQAGMGLDDGCHVGPVVGEGGGVGHSLVGADVGPTSNNFFFTNLLFIEMFDVKRTVFVFLRRRRAASCPSRRQKRTLVVSGIEPSSCRSPRSSTPSSSRSFDVRGRAGDT